MTSAEATRTWREYFDPSFYLGHYADVRNARIDPFFHFLLRGNRERRTPSIQFDAGDYLDRYPDVAASGLNPRGHVAVFGRSEGRIANGVSCAPTFPAPHMVNN